MIFFALSRQHYLWTALIDITYYRTNTLSQNNWERKVGLPAGWNAASLNQLWNVLRIISKYIYESSVLSQERIEFWTAADGKYNRMDVVRETKMASFSPSSNDDNVRV